MQTILYVILAALIVAAALLGAALAAARRDTTRLVAEKAGADAARERAEAELRTLSARHMETERELAATRASAAAELAALRERSDEQRAAERAERERMEETMRLQFKNLAGEILGEQSRQFRQTNKESLDILLKPFRDNIADFRERVERIYSHENEQRGELKNELRNLMELNRRITAETTNLTNALKGNSKVQGDWGEMLLSTILEGSALIRGIHYETQCNIKDAEGRNLRPDVVLHLPEKKHIVIDSKVSLTAFVECTAAESEAERTRLTAAHVASVRQHVKELGSKEYQRLLDSPDFVIMFVPNEPAFLEALKADRTIWSDAYDRKVVISSPTNLFALLRLVADLWKYADQDRNTKEIAQCGLKLYEQLVAFTSSLEGVGTALGKARDAYDDAYKRLCTGNDNIVRVGERLKRTARLETKRQHSVRTLEAAAAEEECEA
ncbi:DNA recombination protein RmuC [Alistipes sp.]|uniref:DNA recombination protein RmuC n=2 Tax=Alistipes TaxID=239759 RepID=UPI000E888DE0|nr:DNA recombination protein RmuC [Alistipes sp.]HBX89885.1 DNA recombination protein RmuC [Alistipes sp.]